MLEVLGNETRRKILDLLSKKPCYVSELSYYLRVAPKALIEHLEKLEKAGIISSFEDGKRKYYYISKRLDISIVITPHTFRVEIKDAPETVDFEVLVEKIKEIEKLEELEVFKAIREIENIRKIVSTLHFTLNSQIDDFIEKTIKEMSKFIEDETEMLVFTAMTKGMNTFDIAEHFRIPYREVERVVKKFVDIGLFKI
ncbi:MAG: ArsR family transcriptional regulator [Archaeoglobaceae archaeon]|nr:ArsR family transcriptional regulator [Archaeoglobaceae archaeon]MCX8152136.1 ArsR family transcriptional regulator [Archaeoglobaceae archaeon]MDW8013572.1 ArsR family transcriptional regulator [Archaeoglobaceae archaeon]